MQIFFNPNHINHQSPFEVFDGEQTPHQEIRERVETIMAAVRENHSLQTVEEISPELAGILEQLHDPEYLRVLNELSQSSTGFHYPSTFLSPDTLRNRGVVSPRALQGAYSFDTYTSIHKDLWEVAQMAAESAHQAALHALETGASYSLNRPPGHHAQRRVMGGYCYLNNAAVAAQTFINSGHQRVATLDVDIHHGNGTQDVFCARKDVLTVSIHANPETLFPFYCGFEDELGTHQGTGYNLNLVGQPGTGDQEYRSLLTTALNRIREHQPESLVVSFGADTHVDDPIGNFELSSEYYVEMANEIASLEIPTAIIQEGGYNTGTLGTNVSNFLQGFEQ